MKPDWFKCFKPAIGGCGNTHRVQVEANAPPYTWICSLTVHFGQTITPNLTGFKLHIPNANKTVIVTSAGNIVRRKRYAKKVEVVCPGRHEIVKNDDLTNMPCTG